MTIQRIPYERESLLDRFIRQTNKDGPIHPYDWSLGVCWVWTGAIYANCQRPRLCWQGIDEPASRTAFRLFKGDCKDQLVCHSCDNGMCVNPDHLWLGTYSDNWNDCVSKGRDRQIRGDDHYTRRNPELAPRGEKNGSHKLERDDVLAIRASNATTSELASVFGVSKSLVLLIRQRRRWRHL